MDKRPLCTVLAAGVLCMGTFPVQAAAYTNSSASTEGTLPFTADSTGHVPVTAEKGETFTVTIPKTITLSGRDAFASCTVNVRGDIAGTEAITVIPDAAFPMESEGKEPVTAKTTMDKTSWDYTDALGNGTDAEFTISAPDLTAGSWTGHCSFTVLCEDLADMVPGLYSADGVCLYTWDELVEDYGLTVTETLALQDDAGMYDGLPQPGSYFFYDSSRSNSLFSIIYDTDNLSDSDKMTLAFGESVDIPVREGFDGITSIRLPDGMTEIAENAFYLCNFLTSVTFPDSLEDIGISAFERCTSLEKADLPSGLKSIGDDAFYGSGIRSAVIPDSVTSIGRSAFHCSGLTSLVIGRGITQIPATAFANCESLSSVSIPDTVTSLGESAFNGCFALEELTIPDSVTSLGNAAFAHCTNLDLTVPDSVTSIGRNAFLNVKHVSYTGTAVSSDSWGDNWGAGSFN